jgi:hypothetical protein
MGRDPIPRHDGCQAVSSVAATLATNATPARAALSPEQAKAQSTAIHFASQLKQDYAYVGPKLRQTDNGGRGLVLIQEQFNTAAAVDPSKHGDFILQVFLKRSPSGSLPAASVTQVHLVEQVPYYGAGP